MELERTFIAIVDMGSLNRAAEHLGVAKSTVSARLSELEGKLEATLLQRSAKGIHLTEIGRIYYTEVKSALKITDDVEALVKKMSLGTHGNLSLRCPPGLFESSLVKPLSSFMKLHPTLTLDVRTTDKILDHLREGADICFHWGSAPDSRLYAQRIFEDEIIFVAGEKVAREIEIGDNEETIELLQLTKDFGGRTKRQIVVSERADWIYDWPSRITTDTIESQISLLLENFSAAAVLPKSYVSDFIKGGGLVDITKKLRRVPVPIVCYAITSEKPSPKSRTQQLINHIKKSVH